MSGPEEAITIFEKEQSQILSVDFESVKALGGIFSEAVDILKTKSPKGDEKATIRDIHVWLKCVKTTADVLKVLNDTGKLDKDDPATSLAKLLGLTNNK